jgi:hypothetical protein
MLITEHGSGRLDQSMSARSDWLGRLGIWLGWVMNSICVYIYIYDETKLSLSSSCMDGVQTTGHPG